MCWAQGGKQKRAAWVVGVAAVTAQSSQQALATFAFDRASDSAYAAEAGGAWKGANPTAQENPPGTDNGGSGFGIWDFGGGVHSTVFSPYGNLNHFIDGLDFPASIYNDLGAPAFALTNANLVSGAATIATRPFAAPMAINDTFSVNFDTPALLDTSGGSFYHPTVIIEFLNSSGVKTFDIEAGKHLATEIPWRYDHAGGTNVSTGIDPDATSDGSRLAFHLTSSTAGTLTFDINGPDQVAIPITLLAGAPAGIRFSLYANSSGNGSTSSPIATGERELFFDDIHVTAPVFNGVWIKNDSVSNWSSPSSWSGGVPDQPGASAFFGLAITAPQTVNVDGPRMVRTLMFDNTFSYTVAGSAITIDTLIPADGAVQVFSGSHTISAPLMLNRNTTFTMSDAAAKLTLADLTATGRSVMKSGPGTLEVNRVRANSLAVGSGTVKITPAADPTSASSFTSVSQVNSLDISSSPGERRLDLTNTKMIVTDMAIGTWNGSAYTGVAGLVDRGRGTGTWNGSGIVTSMSDATSGVLTTLAVALAEDVGYAGGTFAGQSVFAGDVLVMYTWGGDAELDGDLDGDDYFWIDSNVALSGSVFGYHVGDFDYDGDIDGDDYFIIDSNISFAQTQPDWPTGAGGEVTSVPEPGSLGFLIGVGSALLRMRRTARR